MRALLCAFLTAAFCCAAVSMQKVISFSGRSWTVRPSSDLQGPGPNLWSEDNAFVDENGHLHLKLTAKDGKFYASEVYLNARLGFGRYQWQVLGRVDQLDQNVVFGMFNYPDSEQGPDGTNEIDMEFSRWGDPDAPSGSYTVFPDKVGVIPNNTSTGFNLTLKSNASTHSFTWKSKSIKFSANRGLQNSDAVQQLHSWTFAPKQQAQIPQRVLRVHMNLWCVGGFPPTDGQDVEIIIKSFKFTALRRRNSKCNLCF